MKSSFKNILIISDNAFMCRKFADIIEKKNFRDSEFSFSISPFSDINDFKNIPNAKVSILDLKIQENIDFIIANFDLVISIHCKQIFPKDLVDTVKCINVHPGYNPHNRGWFPQVFSIINKLCIGATIHEIDEKLDNGFIIARELVEKTSFDTSLTLYDKVVEKEIELLDQHLVSIVNNTYETFKPEEEGNLYLKKDFNALLELDLDEKLTMGDFIDRLRALTHGDFKNAYYIDPNTGKKIFVGINLKQEDDE